MRRHLLTVLNYFGYFAYAPSFDEILIFYPIKISKKNLILLLAKEVLSKQIVKLYLKTPGIQFRLSQSHTNHSSPTTNHPLYTLPQYSIIRRHSERSKESNKYNRVNIHFTRFFGLAPQNDRIKMYLSILKRLPFVQFVGITGSSAMTGWTEERDLDLCVVTKMKAIWTTRFFLVLLAKILRVHNKRGVCLNLFFEESDLTISSNKCNSYIAHELLQMKPLIDKGQIYHRFLVENRWIYQYFPNANKLKAESSRLKDEKLQVTSYKLQNNIDRLFKSIQLPIIQRNRTAFYISNTQLWLFKKDFEKKLKRRGLVI